MWVARFEDGSLYAFNCKPVRTDDAEMGYNGWIPDYNSICLNETDCYNKQLYNSYFLIPKDLFPELTWDDEPIEVELKVKER